MRLTLYNIIIRMYNFHGNTKPKKDRQERKKKKEKIIYGKRLNMTIIKIN